MEDLVCKNNDAFAENFSPPRRGGPTALCSVLRRQWPPAGASWRKAWQYGRFVRVSIPVVPDPRQRLVERALWQRHDPIVPVKADLGRCSSRRVCGRGSVCVPKAVWLCGDHQ
jgi:hypothetical protein